MGQLKGHLKGHLRGYHNLSMREIASQLGYAKLTDTIRSIVKEMIENGEAEYLYPDNTNNPNQKIKLK